jgi:hypothetical protein
VDSHLASGRLKFPAQGNRRPVGQQVRKIVSYALGPRFHFQIPTSTRLFWGSQRRGKAAQKFGRLPHCKRYPMHRSAVYIVEPQTIRGTSDVLIHGPAARAIGAPGNDCQSPGS